MTRTGKPVRPLRRPLRQVSVATLLSALWLCAFARGDDPPTPPPVAPPASVPDPAPAPRPEPAKNPNPEAKPESKGEPRPADKPAGDTPGVPAPPAPATTAPPGQLETILVLKDGSQVVGRLVSIEDDKYTILIAGIPTRFAKENVLRVMAQPPVEERYRQMRATLDDTDLDRRVMLAEWLRDRRRYDLALSEVESILKIDAAHPGARQLKKMIELQIDLDKDAERRKAAKEASKQPGKETGVEAQPDESKDTEQAQHFPVLSDDQINLIRVYELDLNNPPRLLIPRELITSLINRYGDDPLLPPTAEQRDQLYQARPSQILDLVYRLKAHELYPLIKVLEDPSSMSAFRRDVHQGWVLNGCASARCHGGENAGRLMLKRTRPADASTIYTNFLILDRFRLADGRALINYEEPEKSPLIQMAMPRNLTTRPHPAVRNNGGIDQWKPPIRSTDDRRYKATLEWIRSMYHPRPDYGITYDPPVPRGTIPLAPGGPAGR